MSVDVKSVFACNEVFFQSREALLILMFMAYEAHPLFLESRSAHMASPQAFFAGFWEWYGWGMATGDEIFAFYSGVVFGVGFVYAEMHRAIRFDDPVMIYGLLPLYHAMYHATGKHNLKRQALLTMIKLQTAGEGVAKEMLANYCLHLTDHYLHAKAVDDAGETLQGRAKVLSGKKWSALRLVIINEDRRSHND